METVSLSAALEREHREIDGGIEEFVARADSPSNDAAPLLRALRGLRRHIYLEEQFLFPPLRAAGMMMPIMVMVREHGELWRIMDRLDARLAGAADAAGREPGPADDGSVLDLCRELLSLLDRHNSKEEPIIYARVDATLDADATARLSTFLDSGTAPADWVCAGAQPARP